MNNDVSAAKDVKEYYEYIFGLAISSADGLKKFFKKESLFRRKKKLDEKWLTVMFEYVFFLIHYTDRFLFESFNKEERASILLQLVEGLISLSIKTFYKDLTKQEKAVLKTDYILKFDKRTLLYSSYQDIVAKKEQELKGTLIWEFGKFMTEIAETERKLPCINYVTFLIPETIRLLNIRGFIENIKNKE